jgi:hypothetical protein
MRWNAQIIYLPKNANLCDRRKANSPSDHSLGCSKAQKQRLLALLEQGQRLLIA